MTSLPCPPASPRRPSRALLCAAPSPAIRLRASYCDPSSPFPTAAADDAPELLLRRHRCSRRRRCRRVISGSLTCRRHGTRQHRPCALVAGLDCAILDSGSQITAGMPRLASPAKPLQEGWMRSDNGG